MLLKILKIGSIIHIQWNGYQHSAAQRKLRPYANIKGTISVMTLNQYLNCALETLLSTSQCFGLAGNTVGSLHVSELVMSFVDIESLFPLTQGAAWGLEKRVGDGTVAIVRGIHMPRLSSPDISALTGAVYGSEREGAVDILEVEWSQ